LEDFDTTYIFAGEVCRDEDGSSLELPYSLHGYICRAHCDSWSFLWEAI